MDKSTLEALNICQQVFRHLMLALAAGSNADLGKVGSLLDAAAARANLDPVARQMLADLALGANQLASAGAVKQ